MYSVVLLAALTAGESSPDFFFHRCHGCHGCHGCYGCHGCWGGWGCHGCAGCYGCYGACYGSCYGGYGCYGGCYGGCCGGCYGGGYGYAGCWGAGYACYGCCGGYDSAAYHGGHMAPMMGAPAGESIGKPKDEDGEMDKDKGKGKKGKGGKEVEPDSVSATRARVVVELPAASKLFIDDRAIENSATRRTFRTPELEKGQAYFYEVRAEVMVDGKPVSETRRVVVRAGETVKADFRPLAHGGKSGVTTVRAR
jgi:uncharacterized protein (TIGR03000 family)